MMLRLAGFAHAVVGLLLALPAIACGAASPTPAEIPAGTWAGEGARASVSADGASFDLDCAGARIAPPLALDGDGRFDLPGWWERRAGPEPYRRRDARFRGRLQGSTLAFEIALPESAETLGPYELALGGSGRPPTLCR